MVVKGRGGEGGVGKERAAHDTPPPLPPAESAAGEQRAIRPETERRRQIRIPKRQKRAGKGTYRPQGGTQLRSLAWGGTPPPQRKTRTSRDSPLNVRTCCGKESMDTPRIKKMGRTWTGKS